ncbi:MAG: DegT/DnrJ/EryC1/StrS family aminotransferase [Proteobacteria bacterium]|nr:DegT/DnrJ/EryC1/StrS family aminotransferase [Pseudomonadota bacterium]
MEFRIRFSGKSHDYTEEEIQTVVRTIKEAEPYTQGRHMQAFQERFAGYIGGGQAFAVCNATAALEMSAQLIGFEPDDEVIIPGHTFTATAYPFVKKGARIVWADMDLGTRVVTPETLAARITPRTKAIVVVHLYGYAADMPGIMDLAARHNLLVVEDAAQSLGTDVGGGKSGALGDFGVFSLHSHKNITTLGEGGVLWVKDERYTRIVPLLRHNGHTGFDFEREHYWVPAMGNVDMPELDGRFLMPNNFCLGEVECALGAKMLERIDRINAEKRARALTFIDALAGFPELEFHRVDTTRHNYHLLAARMTSGRRDEFMAAMAYQKGIQCVVQYYPLYRYPFYQKIGMGQAECPNTDRFFDHMVSFPFHHWLSDDDLEYMLDSTREVLLSLR